MKLIRRDSYLDRLIESIGTPDIKVITGVRRCGKSKLLEAFKEHVLESVPGANVVHVNFNLVEFEGLLEYHALLDHVESSFDPAGPNFVLIDEVQMCDGFEKAVNSLHASEKYDIYITGSNAFLLSSDLATLFTGRTFEVEVFPFSFAEYRRYHGEPDVDAAFDRYVLEGGMAGSYIYKTPEARYRYVAGVFDTLIVRDIRQKHRVRSAGALERVADFMMDSYIYKTPEARYRYVAGVFDTLIVRDIRQKHRVRSAGALERVADFMMDNVSNITSARSIAAGLGADGADVSDRTVGSYLDHLCKAFLLYKMRRYDIRGKKYLSSGDKYYLCDHSFRYAKLGTRNLDYGRVYENIVAIELMRRGWEVYVGVLYKKEVDFVAMRRGEKVYIQVSDDISGEKTFARECAPLLEIRDAYPKMVIARTKHDEYDHEGIRIVDIARWLDGE